MVGDHECINCGKCMDACSQGAISIKAGKITLKAPAQGCVNDRPDAPDRRRKRGRILWGIALAVLCFALLWFNVLDPAVKKEPMPGKQPAATVEPTPDIQAAAIDAPEATFTAEAIAAPEATAAPETTFTAEAIAASETETVPETEAAPEATTAPEAAEDVPEATGEQAPMTAAVSYDSDAPEGREPGERLPDFTLPCYGGSEFHLADQRGKIVFINLWATSGTPCKHELPYFSDLYKSHQGDIAMLVVHSSMVMDDPEEYLADKGYAMPFATDDDDDTVAESVGSTGTFPQTIVLNRRGEVVYNKLGSVTPEMLAALYDEAEGS